MALRLSELYDVGDRVDVRFEDLGDDGWLPARVLGFQRPGVWVQLPDGSAWFVTNTRRIRAHSDPEKEPD